MNERERQITIHVVPRGDGWAVKSAGASRAARVTATQAEAIERGRQIAVRAKTDLVVHRRDGTIRSKDSFGPDPLARRRSARRASGTRAWSSPGGCGE